MACFLTKVIDHSDQCLILDLHILATMNNEHIGWGPDMAHHHFCMLYQPNNFNTGFLDTTVSMFRVRVAEECQLRKFRQHIERMTRLNDAVELVQAILPEKWCLS